MPAITDLEALATDRDYATAVRDVTRQLIAADALDGHDLRHALPLATYGPRQAGSILRLRAVLQMVQPTRMPDSLLQ